MHIYFRVFNYSNMKLIDVIGANKIIRRDLLDISPTLTEAAGAIIDVSSISPFSIRLLCYLFQIIT